MFCKNGKVYNKRYESNGCYVFEKEMCVCGHLFTNVHLCGEKSTEWVAVIIRPNIPGITIKIQVHR